MSTHTKTTALFTRLRAIYGSRWSSCYASPEAVELAIAEWADLVERMTDQQLQSGIEWAKACSPWPPSLAEFVHAGLGIDDVEIRERAIRLCLRKRLAEATYRDIERAERDGRMSAIRELVAERLGRDEVLPGATRRYLDA
jgi:hypothetical protein